MNSFRRLDSKQAFLSFTKGQVMSKRILSIFAVFFLSILILVPMWKYLWINRWFFLVLAFVFLIGSLLLKINSAIDDTFPPFSYWITFAIASGFYYSVWQQPEVFGALLGNFFPMGFFSIKNEQSFYYAVVAWIGITLMGYSLPWILNSKGEMSNDKAFGASLLSFFFAMFSYLIYLNITVTMISLYFGRY